jgi:protein involved in temperature-dependent protein secretion
VNGILSATVTDSIHLIVVEVDGDLEAFAWGTDTSDEIAGVVELIDNGWYVDT